MSFILRQLSFSVFYLLTIPGQVLLVCQLLLVSYVSQRINERAILASLSQIWFLPFFITLVLLPNNASMWVRYGLLTGIQAYPYCHPILVSWNAQNSNAVRTRAVSAALYNMFVQAGAMVASNIYRADDAPYYRRGNKILLGITGWNIVMFYSIKAFYIWRNRIREAKWAAMTKQEQNDYVLTSKDEGLKRLDFRFAH